MDNLPQGFTYLKIGINEPRVLAFRIKEIETKNSATNWLKKFSEMTYSAWRVSTTYPKAGHTYKTSYRCEHYTDRRAAGVRPSKHTGCNAKLVITIQRFIENAKTQNNDEIKEYPAMVVLRGIHNHPPRPVSALKCRDLSLEEENQMEEVEDEMEEVEDEMEEEEYKMEKVEDEMGEEEYQMEKVEDEMGEEEYQMEKAEDKTEEEAYRMKFQELCSRLDSFVARIVEGIQRDPKNYVPAIRTFLSNVQKFSKTETGFLTCLHTFGKHNGNAGSEPPQRISQR